MQNCRLCLVAIFFPATLDAAILRSSALQNQHLEGDLAMVHVPLNFGNTVAAVAAVGSQSGITYSQVAALAEKGWDAVNARLQPDGKVWGPINPDLHVKSKISGCKMYYTPQSQWPKELADKYFGNKTAFGVLRDPYERVMALYRGSLGKGARAGEDFKSDGQVCDVSKFVKRIFGTMKFATMHKGSPIYCQLQEQAPFFEGEHGIKIPIDMRTFPHSANQILQEHGYPKVHIATADLMHVSGCDDTWVGDMDSEAKALIREYYKRDFELLCKFFGYCNANENVCLRHVPGMCPSRLFKWSHELQESVPL